MLGAEGLSRPGAIVLGALVLLVVAHLGTYAALPPTPGNMPAFPLGWWGWWDQSQYLRSARAFAARDLRPSEHWYPFGYALLGAPFTRWSAGHPYLLADLGCEVATFLCFLAFARRAADVDGAAASLLFLLATCGSASVRAVWSEPWNTTLSAALIWALLALAACRRDGPPGPRAAACAGVLAAAIVATRPTDALLVAIWGAWFAGSLMRAARASGGRRPAARSLAAFAAGLAGAGLPLGALWIAIYGAHPSPYVVGSRRMGFAWSALPWRAYLLLSAPRPWFAEGTGLVQRLPWLLPGFAALVAAPLFLRGRMRLLAAMVAATFVLFCAYVDLIPSGLWRYNNVHYFKWTFPGLCLLGWTAARDAVAAGRGRRFACVLLAVVLASAFRLLPAPAAAGGPAWMVEIDGPVPAWERAYFSHDVVRDGAGPLTAYGVRAFPASRGWRLVAFDRPFRGTITIRGSGGWPDGQWPEGAAGERRWTRRPGIAWPWMRGG